MEKVQIYNNQEEMWKQLGREVYRNNFKNGGTFGNLYKKAMLEYKEESGFNMRFLEAQGKKKTSGSTFLPAQVALHKDEQEKFNEVYHDLGNGLEQKVLVSLFTEGNKYSFGEGNRGELLNSFEEGADYDNITSLAQGVKEELSKIKYFGIIFSPIFYTTKEEVPIAPEHISNNPEGFLRQFTEDAKKDSALSVEFNNLFLDGLRDFAYSKDKIRGLNEVECSEFERLYNPNTI